MNETNFPLLNKTVLVTGGARRVGRHVALSLAQAGANIVIHHSNSPEEARQVASQITQLGRRAWVTEADFSKPETVEGFVDRVWAFSELYAVVHNAAIFEPIGLAETSLAAWQRHMDINLTVPFLISRDFAAQLKASGGQHGRIVTMLDWRALRPSKDHLPYTISKAGLAALTRSLAAALAPNIAVNGLAMGAILPPSDGADQSKITAEIPAGRWARLDEVSQALLFLLTGPDYLTGDVLYLDGGRHLI